jgi:hypothetical protein
MKKFLFGAMALFMAAGFVACKDEKDPTYYYSYGTVVEPNGESTALRIRKDAGSYLTVEGWTGGMATGDRVIVVYEVKGELVDGGNNTVKLASIYQVLTKDPLMQSELTEDEEKDEKLGNDGLVEIEPWFGGEYLNVDFRALFANYSNTKHFINLVANDIDFDGETLTVTMRHNAYGELPESNNSLYWNDGMVSFNLVNLFEELGIEDEANYPNIILEWEKFDNISANATSTQTVELGKFKPWTKEVQAVKADVMRTETGIE